MATQVILPRVDMDMATGKMGRWFVKEGASVEKGQLLFEIETDKAAMEIEAPASGVLRALSAQAGDELPVGSVIGWIYAPGEAYEPGLSEVRLALAAIQSATPGVLGRMDGDRAPREPTLPVGDLGPRATPLARRLARERGVDLSQVAGSGPNGRVQARDIDARAGAQLSEKGPERISAGPCAASLNRVWLGHGDGAPIVLIHGFGSDLNGWRPLFANLKTTRPVLALDLPGHGKSPLIGEPSFEAMVDAVEATLLEERVEAAHLVGHSLGSAVASALIGRSSFKARSLMLIAAAGLGPDINGAFLAGFLQARSEASLTPWMRLLVADEALLGSALVKTTMRQRADSGVDGAQRKIVGVFFPDGAQTVSQRAHLASLQIPAKIVFGLDDQIIPARHANGLPGRIGLHLFAGVGHMPHLEARGDVARLLEELVAAGG